MCPGLTLRLPLPCLFAQKTNGIPEDRKEKIQEGKDRGGKEGNAGANEAMSQQSRGDGWKCLRPTGKLQSVISDTLEAVSASSTLRSGVVKQLHS